MKKTIIFLCAIFLGQPVFSAFAANVVTGIQGKPVIIQNGEEKPAEMGMEIQKGDILKTNELCQLDVSLNGGAGVRILASSEADLKEVAAENTRIDLKVGNLIANLKKKIPQGSKFEVETPAAVLAVRGTQFWGQVTEDAQSKTTFAVREGVLNITSKADSQVYTLEAGQAIELPLNEKNPHLRKAAEKELAAIATCEQIKIQE